MIRRGRCSAKGERPCPGFVLLCVGTSIFGASAAAWALRSLRKRPSCPGVNRSALRPNCPLFRIAFSSRKILFSRSSSSIRARSVSICCSISATLTIFSIHRRARRRVDNFQAETRRLCSSCDGRRFAPRRSMPSSNRASSLAFRSYPPALPSAWSYTWNCPYSSLFASRK